MDLNIDTLMCLRYHILYVSIIAQKGFIHGHDTLSLHGKNHSAIDEQTETGSKRTPPTTCINCVVEKKRSEVKKWKPQIQFRLRIVFTGGVCGMVHAYVGQKVMPLTSS